jgi:hypothetical protein
MDRMHSFARDIYSGNSDELERDIFVAEKTVGAGPGTSSGFAELARLSSLDQSVIALAAFDHRISVEPSGVVARLFQYVFGEQNSNRLADDRLEALRRYAILYRLEGPQLPPLERSRLTEAGFDDHQKAQIDRLVERSKNARKFAGKSNRLNSGLNARMVQ